MRRPLWGWPLTITLSALLALAAWPVLSWATMVWLNTALGSIGAALFALPISVTLIILTRRLPDWPREPPKDQRGGLGLYLTGLGLMGSCLWLGREGERWWMLMAGAMGVLATLGVVWGRMGGPRARALALPISVVVFCLPWEWALRGLDPALQRWSTVGAHGLMELAGYEVSYWGEFGIHTPKYWVEVNETCSGINMLITFTFFAMVYGWASQRRWQGKVALLVITPALAIGANTLRVATILLLGHYGGDALAQGPWHYGSAYIVFLPMFGVLYWVGRLLDQGARQRGQS